MEPCTVTDLKRMEFDKTVHPSVFYDGALAIAVNNWADLCAIFVRWLVQNKYLSANSVPIHNHAKRDKYFINNAPRHAIPGKDGDWRAVGQFYVDTKYNADAHIKNILSTLEQLGVVNPHFSISFNVP